MSIDDELYDLHYFFVGVERRNTTDLRYYGSMNERRITCDVTF
jgi:hypothetical protein